MKKQIISLLFVSMIALPGFCGESEKMKACKENVRQTVLSTAKIMGLDKKIGLYLDDPVPAGTSQKGAKLFSISSGPFLYDDGKAGEEGSLLGTGASAKVYFEGGGCKVLSLEVNLGQ